MKTPINPDKFRGPYTVLKIDAEVEAKLTKKRAIERFICETIIENNDDPKAVQAAKTRLAELDAIEKRPGDLSVAANERERRALLARLHR
ncbi:hypothetical protein [Mesorhizobium sp. M0488]|uniref:hypothetical protein n=1 Tax=unclassified Mesorhizobium TaxID=325217 RepID=UPI00333DD1C8